MGAGARGKKRWRRWRGRWPGAAAALAASALSVAFWFELRAREEALVLERVAHEVEPLGAAVEQTVTQRFRALVRMASRWELRGGTPRAEWEADAAAYVRDQPSYLALQWIDGHQRVRWTVSREGAPEIAQLDLSGHPPVRATLQSALFARAPRVSPPFWPLREGTAILVAVPLFVEERFDGFIAGVFRVEDMLDALLRDRIAHGFGVAIYDGAHRLFASEDEPPGDGARERALEVQGATWRLRVWPTPALRAASRSAMPELVLAGGLAAAVLLGLVAALAQNARASARELARANAELSRANEELERFAYSTSHELRSPLVAIRNLSRWIEDDLGPAASARAHDLFELLRGRIVRMETLLSDLLTYARCGQLRAETEPVDVHALVGEIREILHVPAGFEVVAGPGLETFETARAPLLQVLANLIGNAIKHHDRPTGRVEVAGRDLDDLYEITVTDDGPGIPPEYRERVLEMFETLRPRDEVEGSGIGLAVVRRIVAGVGGDLRIEGGPDRGTRIVFTWPRRWPRPGA